MAWIALAISSTLFTGFLLGWILKKPGAGGGMIGASVGLGIQYFLASSPDAVFWSWVLVGGTFLLGLITIDVAENLIFDRWGTRKRHTGEIVFEDYNETNLDEVHGQLVAGLPVFYLLSAEDFIARIIWLIFAFVLFRVFDTLKPGPVQWAENFVPISINGNGVVAFPIMLDDTVAGILAAVSVGLLMLGVNFVM